MRTLRLTSLLLSLLLPPLALASNTADEADVAFELGNEAYSRGQYVEALRSYFTSYRLVPNRNVLFNIARCYEALNRFNEAYRYYADLSVQQLEEDDKAEVKRAMERLRPKVALVEITSEPKGAQVYVDREDLGVRGLAPQTLALTPGRHKIRVRLEGYRDAEAQATLTRGRTFPVHLPLERILGSVEVSGTPAGAEIRESPEGPVLGTVPTTLRFPPGSRMLYLRAAGHAPDQRVVEVKADTVTPFSVSLRVQEKPTGRLIVTANRDNATVRVDGRPAGFTPTVVTLPEGPHTLEVESREVSPLRQQVTVVAEQETRIHAELRYAPPPVRAASKSALSIDEAPASITVLSQEELRAFGYATVAEALAAVRGMFLTDDRMYTFLGVRGFSPPGDLNTRVLVLWDGHPLNDVWAGQAYLGHDLTVDLEEVERIEVVRGPGSALYGTGAFFAVINIVPRDTLEGGRNVEFTGAVGALGTSRGHVLGGLRDANSSLMLSVGAYTMTGAESTLLGSTRVQGLDDARAGTVSLRARVGDFTFHGRLHGRAKQLPTAPFDTVPGAAGTQVQDVRGFAELRFDKKLGQVVDLSLRGAFDTSYYRGYWMYDDTRGGLRRDTDAGGADWLSSEARATFQLADTHRLAVGLEGQLQLRVEQEVFGAAGVSPRLSTPRRTLLSAYVMDEWKPHPRFSLSAGLRVDKFLELDANPSAPGATPSAQNSYLDPRFSPRLALILRPYDKGLTKLVAGSAFRAPNVYELYYFDNFVTQRPASDLGPETITTFELEHAHDLTDELRLTVAGYHNRIYNLISLEAEELATPGCGQPVGTSQCLAFTNSSGETLAWGAEAGLHWQPARYLLVDFNYSLASLRHASAEVARTYPTHLFSGRVLVPVPNTDVRLAAQALYQVARGAGAEGPSGGEALLLNVGLSGEMQHLRYFAGVQNLLGAQYQLPAGAEVRTGVVPQYGRTFTLQLTGGF